MGDTCTTKGYWWLPAAPENRLAGEITYGPATGACLNVQGHFFSGEAIHEHKRGFTVLGTTTNGKLVSLFDCRTLNVRRHIPGSTLAIVSSYFGVLGGHFARPEDMRFASVTASFTHLREWTWATGIRNEPSPSGHGHRVTWEPIPDHALCSLGALDLKLAFPAALKSDVGAVSIQEDCMLKIEAPDAVPFADLESVIYKLQGFFALAVTRPVYALSVTAYAAPQPGTEEGLPSPREFELIRNVSIPEAPAPIVTPWEMQFSLGDLKPTPGCFISRYFQKAERLNPVLSLYLSTVYSPRLDVRQHFLSLAHAIEAYHRAFIGGKYLSDEDYQGSVQTALSRAIPKDIDPDFRASLKNKLRYLHEYSLRKRVRDICERFEALLRPYLPPPSGFASTVADQRNSLTHPDSTVQGHCPEPDWTTLWLKTQQLALVVELCLLHELGFDADSISACLRRNRRTEAIRLNSHLGA